MKEKLKKIKIINIILIICIFIMAIAIFMINKEIKCEEEIWNTLMKAPTNSSLDRISLNNMFTKVEGNNVSGGTIKGTLDQEIYPLFRDMEDDLEVTINYYENSDRITATDHTSLQNIIDKIKTTSRYSVTITKNLNTGYVMQMDIRKK